MMCLEVNAIGKLCPQQYGGLDGFYNSRAKSILNLQAAPGKVRLRMMPHYNLHLHAIGNARRITTLANNEESPTQNAPR